MNWKVIVEIPKGSLSWRLWGLRLEKQGRVLLPSLAPRGYPWAMKAPLWEHSAYGRAAGRCSLLTGVGNTSYPNLCHTVPCAISPLSIQCTCPLQEAAARIGLFQSSTNGAGRAVVSTPAAFLQLEKDAPSGGSIAKKHPVHLAGQVGISPNSCLPVQEPLCRALWQTHPPA